MPIDPELQAILDRCLVDLPTFARTFFPDRFYRPFDPIHYDMCNMVMDEDAQRSVTLAPRGIGKTTIYNFLNIIHAILFQRAMHIVVVSASEDMAIERSEDVKQALVGSELITKIFGQVKTKTFSKKMYVVKVGDRRICVKPRGAGQKIRGLLFEGVRPDLVVVDDLEDPENVDSPIQRKKKEDWFYGSLLPIVDRGSDKWRVKVVGTVLHQDSLVVKLSESKNWKPLELELCDDDYRSNAPNFMDDAACRALADEHRADGQIHTFYREYRNMPAAGGEDATFPDAFFEDIGFDPTKIAWGKPWIDTFVLLDPAKTSDTRNAESAIDVVSVDYRTGRIYFRDCLYGHWDPGEIEDHFIAMILSYRPTFACIEVTGLNEWITYPLKNALSRRAAWVDVIELKSPGGPQHEGAKITRVGSLVPFYRKRLIRHNKAISGKLETQLRNFPASRLWDVMDIFGYIPKILEDGGQYMQPFNGEEWEGEGEALAMLDDYEDLEDPDYEPLEFGII